MTDTTTAPLSRDLAVELPGTAQAPGLARRAVERLDLDQAHLPTVTLLTSELVTNAVRHAASAGPIRLKATIRDHRLRLCVTDSGTGFDRPRPPRPAQEHGGYGLFLVEELASRWGVCDTTVWFELRTAGRTA